MTDAIAAAAATRREHHIALLRQLIQLQREGEAAIQARIAETCVAMGCDVTRLRYTPADVAMRDEFAASESMAAEPRESVVARWNGTGGRSLIFFSHPDGEPIRGTEAWSHDPFAGTISNGRIHGWGVADDLAGVAAQTLALETLLAAGLAPRGDVILASTPSKRHARGVSAVMNAGHLADAAIYMHPAESGVGMREVKAICGGQLYLRITVPGRLPPTNEPGHTAFAHQALNPLDPAMRLVAALQKLDAERAARVRYAPIERAVGRATNILVSHLSVGDAARYSRIALEAVIGVAISFPPGERMADLQREVEAALAAVPLEAAPRLEWLSGVTGAEVPDGHPLFAAVSDAVRSVCGAEPFVNPLHTSSDIRVPNVQQGIPCVGLGPLCGDLSQNGRHDEWVDVEDYLRSIEVAARAIANWCGVTPR
jgi:acetylornithine deacetylase